MAGKDRPWDINVYDGSGKIIGKIVHGKKMQQ